MRIKEKVILAANVEHSYLWLLRRRLERPALNSSARKKDKVTDQQKLIRSLNAQNLLRWLKRYDFMFLAVVISLIRFVPALFESNVIPGFTFRQDGYWELLIAYVCLTKIRSWSLPFGIKVINIYGGFPIFIHPLALAVYGPLIVGLILTGDIRITWISNIMLFTTLSTIAMYKLTFEITKSKWISLICSVYYSSFQPIFFGVWLGHISELAAHALLPALIFYGKKYLNATRGRDRGRFRSLIKIGIILLVIQTIRTEFFIFYSVLIIGPLLLLFIFRFYKSLPMKILIMDMLLLISLLIANMLTRFYAVNTGVIMVAERRPSPQRYSISSVIDLIAPVCSIYDAYLGVSGTFLAMISLYSISRGRDKSYKIYFFVIFLLLCSCILLSLGTYGPFGLLWDYWYKKISFASVPYRALAPFPLLLSIFMIPGVKRILSKLRSKAYKSILAIALAITLVVDNSIFLMDLALYHDASYIEFPYPHGRTPPPSDVFLLLQERPGKLFIYPMLYSVNYFNILKYELYDKVTLTGDYVQLEKRPRYWYYLNDLFIPNFFKWNHYDCHLDKMLILTRTDYMLVNKWHRPDSSMYKRLKLYSGTKLVFEDANYMMVRNPFVNFDITGKNILDPSSWIFSLKGGSIDNVSILGEGLETTIEIEGAFNSTFYIWQRLPFNDIHSRSGELLGYQVGGLLNITPSSRGVAYHALLFRIFFLRNSTVFYKIDYRCPETNNAMLLIVNRFVCPPGDYDEMIISIQAYNFTGNLLVKEPFIHPLLETREQTTLIFHKLHDDLGLLFWPDNIAVAKISFNRHDEGIIVVDVYSPIRGFVILPLVPAWWVCLDKPSINYRNLDLIAVEVLPGKNRLVFANVYNREFLTRFYVIWGAAALITSIIMLSSLYPAVLTIVEKLRSLLRRS